MSMNRRMREQAAIAAALAELNKERKDYSLGDVAALTGLTIGVIGEHVCFTGCQTEWARMWNTLSKLGCWEIRGSTSRRLT